MKYLCLVAVFLVGLIPLSAAEFNPDAVAQQLSNEFGCNYYLQDGQKEGAYKFRSNGSGRIVWVFHPPQSAYEADSLQLMKVRYDNLGQDKVVYHLLVEDTAYKLHLQEDAACLRIIRGANEAHIALIKAWVATFKGQEISLTLVAYTE